MENGKWKMKNGFGQRVDAARRCRPRHSPLAPRTGPCHSALRTPHSALRTPPSPLATRTAPGGAPFRFSAFQTFSIFYRPWHPKGTAVRIKKAVITAAGRNQNSLPLQSLVDRDGAQKSALQIIIEEALSTGVEEICVVICPGDRDRYALAAGPHAQQLRFVEQARPLGYGHALFCAREFVGEESFLHLVSDHLYLSRSNRRCAEQLVEIAATEACSVSAVQATRENLLPLYGAVGGKRVPNRAHLYQIDTVLEKPTPTEAEQKLIVPGLRAGHYLCFFGMHVLSPSIMGILSDQITEAGERWPTQLSGALVQLAERERCLACIIDGRRFNIGVKFGLMNAQLALALNGNDREEVLAQLVELLAQRFK
jgi:UTP--glucose-1-phosphate uridylyltransferase